VRFIVNPFFIGLWAETHLTLLHALRRSNRHGCALYSRSPIPDGSINLLLTAGVTIRHKIGAQIKLLEPDAVYSLPSLAQLYLNVLCFMTVECFGPLIAARLRTECNNKQ